MAFDSRLGEVWLGNLELGYFVPDVLPPLTGSFTCSGALAVAFTGHTTPAPVPPEVVFNSVLGQVSPGRLNPGMVYALAYIKSVGATLVVFNVPNPTPRFRSDGSTFVRWIITNAGTIFEIDGATAVSFTGKSTASFRGAGATSIVFTGNTGGRVILDGSTDVQFLVTGGQSAACILGDGVAPPRTGPRNAVH